MKTFPKEVPAGDCGCEHRKWAVVNRQSPRDWKRQVLQLGNDTWRPMNLSSKDSTLRKNKVTKGWSLDLRTRNQVERLNPPPTTYKG